MPNTLKIKRGLAASIPQGQLAEPLFTTDTYDLYIGKGSGGNQRIQNYIASGTSSQFLKGDGSLDSNTYQTALTFTSPLVNTSGTVTINQSSGSADGYLSSTDWTTFNSKEPAVTAGTTLQYYRGDKTFQTLDTAVVPENGAIYFTEPRVRATVLTGLNLSGGGTISASDSILTAFGKVQNQISAIGTGVAYQGTWNANTNTPTITSGVGTAGYYYVVNVAGSTNIDGITDWNVGDWIIFNGTVWDQVDNTDAVSSVNGFTGAVNLALDNISDVSAASPTNAQLLRFNGTSSLWENWTPNFEPALTKGNLTETTSSVLTITGGTGAVIGSGTTIAVAQSSGSTSGYLSSTDWTTFNSKQAQLNGTGFVKASGTTISYDNSTYLTTSDAASTYLPLTGGTLTGALNGTSATFSASVTTPSGFYIDANTYLYEGTLRLTDLVGKKNILQLQASSSGHYITSTFLSGGSQQAIYISAKSTAGQNVIFNTDGTTTFSHGITGTTASFTSNSGNFNLGSQADTAIYAHFGSKSASGGQAVAMRLAGTLTATANFDNLFGLWVDYTDNAAGYAGVTRYGIYQNDSGKRNYFGGLTTFNSAVTGSDTITATAFIPSGTSVPSRGMYSSASNYLDFSTNGTRAITISDGQKVGIGADPISAYRLYVNGDVYASGTVYGSSGSFVGTGTFGSSVTATNYSASNTESFRTYNDNGYISFFNSANSSRQGYLQVQSTALTLSAEGGSAFMAFATGGGAERMRITSAGDMYLTGRSTNGDYAMYFYSNDTDSRIYSSNSGAVSKSLMFYTSGTERMRIRSGGEISFIPTTWTYVNPSTSYRNMDFGAGGWLYRDNSDVYLTSNNYYNTSGQWVAKYSYAEGLGILSLAGGNFTWNTYNGSVTAGTGYSLSPRFLITPGGNVAIGDTTSDGYRVKIKNSDYGLFLVAGSTTTHSIFIVQDAAQTSTYFRIRGGDGLMFSLPTYNNTTSSAANITVFSDGSMFRSTASSIRFKENITDWNANGLNTILALKPKTFTYKQDYYKHPEKVMLGLIAEEVAEVCPYLADYENEDGSGNVENVRYANIVVPLIKAIQEQQAQIEELKSKLN